MLTRLNFKRGEGKLVEVGGSQKEPKKRRERLPQSPPPSSPPKEAEAPLIIPHEEGEIHEEFYLNEEETMFRKAFLDMTEMVRIIYQERNERLEGEVSKLQKEGQGSSGGQHDEDKSKKGNGGNGGNGEPPCFPSSSSSSSTSSSAHQPHKSKSTSKSPLLELDVKFKLPVFNYEVNADKLDNWI